jgi:hypothetical protein
MIGAMRDHKYRRAVTQQVIIRTQTEGHPTSTNLPLSPTEVDQPVRSIAEYILAREKIKWKKAYEYVTGFAFSLLSSSLVSNGSKGFPARGELGGESAAAEDPARTAEYTTDKTVVSNPKVREPVETAFECL